MKAQMIIFGILLSACEKLPSQKKEPYVHYFLYKNKVSNCQSILEKNLSALIGDEAGILLEEKNLNLPSGMAAKTYEYQNGLLEKIVTNTKNFILRIVNSFLLIFRQQFL
jgi:hypothetical protein